MKGALLVARMDAGDSFRSRWFAGYAAVFVALAALIIVTGVTEGRVMGFTGLTRSLLIFVQACDIIMPIFVLATTVRSIAGDRENNVLEYLLSFPVPLSSYYFGKFLGRLLVVTAPLIISLFAALLIGALKGGGVPAGIFIFYAALLCVNAFVFLGTGFFISSLFGSQESALGAALFVWLFLIAFIDAALIGMLIRGSAPENLVFALALLNPVQVFRIGAFSLFDPALSVIGPASYFILDSLGRAGCMVYALLYPLALGTVLALSGYALFKRGDLV